MRRTTRTLEKSQIGPGFLRNEFGPFAYISYKGERSTRVPQGRQYARRTSWESQGAHGTLIHQEVTGLAGTVPSVSQ